MSEENKVEFDNRSLWIKWDNKGKVGTITTLSGKEIHFFSTDIDPMIQELVRIWKLAEEPTRIDIKNP